MGWLGTAAVLVAGALAVEFVLRGVGLGAFPLFEPAEHGVYRMRPDQRGRFMRRYAWKYDANGMRNDRQPEELAETTVLVGDSIVDGGLRIDQSGTLAAQAARISGQEFYSVACHGWALANILGALTALPGWASAKRLIFVLNSGDFDTVGTMGSELSFPTRRPIWLTLWLVRREAYRRLHSYRCARAGRTEIPERQPGNQDLRNGNLAVFRKLLTDYAGLVVLVRYPLRDENVSRERYFEQLASLDPRIRILDLATAADWSGDCYSDHIHPNARGFEVLARHLCQGLS